MTMCVRPFSPCECLFCLQQSTEKSTCDCAVCVSGQAVNVQKWRKTDPRHEKIYQAMQAAVASGETQVQGA